VSTSQKRFFPATTMARAVRRTSVFPAIVMLPTPHATAFNHPPPTLHSLF
jgi:hypothetical protein